MTILSRLSGPSSLRAITSIPVAGADPIKQWGADLDWGNGNTIAGVNVSAATALNATAVWACVRLLSMDIAGLPVHAYSGKGKQRVERPLPLWASRPMPNANITWGVYLGQVVVSLLLDGNAFVEAVPDVYTAVGLRVHDPGRVVVRTEGWETMYDIGGRRLTPDQMLHIPYVLLPGKARGLNPIDAARESIGLTLAAEQYAAAYFGNGTQLGAYATFPTGVVVDSAAAEELKARMEGGHKGARRAFAFGVLDNGGEIKTASTSAKDSDLSTLRVFQVEEVARAFGIPPHMIGSQAPGAVAYASVEQRSIDYVTHAVQGIVERVEDAHNRLLRSPEYLKLKLDGLLRSDSRTRWANYTAGLNAKVIRREEVRDYEDLPYDPEAEGYLETPNNNDPNATSTLDATDTEPQTPTKPTGGKQP